MCKRLIYLTCFVLVLGLAMTDAAKAVDPNLVCWLTFDEDQRHHRCGFKRQQQLW